MNTNGKIPLLDLVTPHQELEDELVSVFKNALKTAAFVGGPMVEVFEREFAEFCETQHCVGVGSGTDAVRLALLAAGIRPGDTVVTVPNTFIATTEAISQVGGRPDFVDIDERAYTMDPEKLRCYLETECTRDMQTERDHGQSRKYFHDIEGYNGRLDAIQAGILRAKLPYLANWNTKRRENARRYDELLAPAAGALTLPYVPGWSRPVHHLYVVGLADRDRLRAELA